MRLGIIAFFLTRNLGPVFHRLRFPTNHLQSPTMQPNPPSNPEKDAGLEAASKVAGGGVKSAVYKALGVTHGAPPSARQAPTVKLTRARARPLHSRQGAPGLTQRRHSRHPALAAQRPALTRLPDCGRGRARVAWPPSQSWILTQAPVPL